MPGVAHFLFLKYVCLAVCLSVRLSCTLVLSLTKDCFSFILKIFSSSMSLMLDHLLVLLFSENKGYLNYTLFQVGLSTI